ncbi:MAG: VCBS repeat-containing protein [Planctomycetota bacterium]|nr:VCBS repeat-containing protein [Planctomycetota bacterium]
MRTNALLPILPLAACIFAMAARAEGLTLTPVPDEQTGLKAIMEAWSAAELKRQGGKFQDHGWWPWGLTAFDFDNDGDLDLVPSHHGVSGGLLLKNKLKETGKLEFEDVTVAVAGDNRNLPGADDRPWAWDFDGDGFLDLGGFSDESKAKSVLNQGAAKFAIASFTFNPLSHASEVADLNGDGFLDLWGYHRDTLLQFFFEPSNNTFQVKSSKREPGIPAERVPQALREEIEALKQQKNNRFMGVGYLTGHDLNGDGREDVIVQISGGYGATIAGRYLVAGEDGSLAERGAELGLPKDGCAILARDLNADGHVDLVVAVGPGAGLYLNDGKGRFTVQPGDLKAFLEKPGPYLLRAWPADLDNDGDDDLVVSNPRLGNEQVYENEGGVFRKVLAAGGWDANPVVICDIDNDGLLDVCIGGPKNTITLYRSSSPKAGRYVKVYPRMTKPNPFAVGAKVEVFKAGALADPAAKPLFAGMARPDGQPVHAGLGSTESVDVRVTFPGAEKKVVEGKGLAANGAWKVALDGSVEAVK